jgi:hypothetical protein
MIISGLKDCHRSVNPAVHFTLQCDFFFAVSQKNEKKVADPGPNTPRLGLA